MTILALINNMKTSQRQTLQLTAYTNTRLINLQCKTNKIK